MFREQNLQVDPRVLYIALFIIILLGIQMLSYIVNLLLVSFILTLMLVPPTVWLKQKGLSHAAAVSVLTVIAIICVAALAAMCYVSFSMVVSDLPMYQTELNLRIAELSAMIGVEATSIDALVGSTINIGETLQMLFSSAMEAGEIAIYVFFIGVTTFFMLLESENMPERIKQLVGGDPQKERQVTRMSQYIIDFMIVRTETNAIHGLVFGTSLWVMGVHGAPLWGLLTFALGYIPYIGLIMASIPAILFAYIQFGMWGAVAVIVIVCALNLIVENPVFSYLASRKFEMPAIIVILSVIFWGWLLGVPGMFFSVPITMLMMIAFQWSDDLRSINTLLGVSHLFEEDPAAEKQG